MALKIATFPDSRASDNFFESCRKAALKAYHSVCSIIDREGDLDWEHKMALEERLERLRAVLEGGRKSVAEGNDGAECVAPPTVGRESAQSKSHDPNRLTTRELEVLKCIAEGQSSKEVAARLGISFKTVTCHRYRIMDKLDIHNTISLVRYAIRIGLLDV